MNYDVIIIGSGLGGLACGALLTKEGLRVCVLERSNQPGGCLQSYKRGGLHFDTGLHYVGALEVGQPLYDAFKQLGLMDLPWKRMDKDFDHVIIGDREFHLSQGYDSFIDDLAKEFPHLRNEIEQYADKLQNDSPDDMDVSAYDWLKKTLKDDLLVDVVSASTMKIEPRAGSLPLFSFLHSNKSYIESAWRLGGNGNMIVEKLMKQITQGGGEVLCHSEVARLNTSDEGITSVTCANGKEYSAYYYISDIHPANLSQMLDVKDRKNRTFSRRMMGCANTYGMFTAQLVLKPDTLPYINHNIFVYDGPVWNTRSEGEVNRVMISCPYPETAEQQAPDKPMYSRQIDLLTPMRWGECLPWAETKVGHRGDDYREMCNRKVKECLALADRAIPGLSDMVENVYTSTPLTYRDYLASPAGTAFGIRKDYTQSMLTFHSVKTPYPNLFLTGQNIILTGIEGVTMTAFDTCRHILDSKEN